MRTPSGSSIDQHSDLVGKTQAPADSRDQPYSGDIDDDNEFDRESETKLEDDSEEDALVLDSDPIEMATWAGQPSIRGSSEAVRMILLTFASIGITYVLRQPGLFLYRLD
jgi:hypothetical protein